MIDPNPWKSMAAVVDHPVYKVIIHSFTNKLDPQVEIRRTGSTLMAISL
jgi:hypothetical protein